MAYEIGMMFLRLLIWLLLECRYLSSNWNDQGMQFENFILKDKKKGYLLTDIGLKLVSELYQTPFDWGLVHPLDYTSDQIHEEAEVLEHTVSDFFRGKIRKVCLGFPKTCPHGGTIPAKENFGWKSTNPPLSKPKKLEPIFWLAFTIALTPQIS